ncbi:MAG: SIS domain-containing protein [Anaerolineales bacterium]|nr:SIS domain-containing protein [Anaerolineales bacterium]
MQNYVLSYLKQIAGMLQRIEEEEVQAIQQAGKVMADAIINGKRLFAFGCTHSSLPVQDLVYRAGGLMLINPICGPGITALDIKPATLTSAMERLEGYAKVLLDNTPIKTGDVLILVSVSGRNPVPVEMAKIARERGITVIGLTSHAYAASVTSRHSSGKKMSDFADIVLDNKVDVGDAVLEMKEIPQKFCPASGVTSIAILQSLVAAAIQACVEAGFTPPVILAANVDGGAEYNAALFEKYHDRIFYM